MSANTEQRKLAAIMFTDMVGYSALSQRNEKLAQELLEEHRALLRAVFPRFNGTEIKTIGDAFLVEFQSALEAAQCAIEIQRTLAKRNHDVPAERRIELKIGIHIGDVVHRGGDVYGDGVNIASRIEPLAGAGGICVSMDVERQIRNALEARFERLGPAELKNISVPMELFRIVLPWETSSSSRREEAHSEPGARKAERARRSESLVTSAATRFGWIAVLVILAVGVGWWFVHQSGQAPKPGVSSPGATNSPEAATTSATGQKSIAVLPFVNMSADKADEYLSDGMTEELLNALAKVPGLRVPGRSSSFAFKGKTEQDIFRKVGEQLRVNTVLEGSVRKAGDKLRITAQLINVADGFHLWSEIYDRDMTNIFAIQSDVAQRVAAALKIQLGVEATERLAKRPTENLEAYQHYLRAHNEWHKFTKEGFEKSIEHANEALRLDARFALAWDMMGRAYTASGSIGYLRPTEAWPNAAAALDKALALDSQLAEAHATRGALALFQAHWEMARRELEIALQLKPSNPDSHELYSLYYAAMGRPQEALRAITRAQELDPLRPNAAAHIANCHLYLGHYERAIQEGRKGLQNAPDFPNLRTALAVAYIANGNPAESVAVMEEYRGVETNPFALSVLGYAYAAAGRKAEAVRVLEKLGQLSPVAPTCWARVYLGLGETNRALEWLERIPAEGDGQVVFLKLMPPFNRLRSEPRFTALLRKLGMEE
jgi:TolB-like protein/class 3 adenylate cyclase/Tfp pilus assembly protein PilF